MSHNYLKFADLLFLAIAIAIAQSEFIPDILRVFLSISFFIIVPYGIGKLLTGLLGKLFSSVSKNYVIFCIGSWSMGVICIFSLGLFLQIIGFFNIYAFVAIIFFFFILSKLTNFGLDFENFFSISRIKINNLWVGLLALLIGLIPPIVQSQLWSFPLSYESDGFLFGLLSKEISQQNFIDLYSTIHLPIESAVLSIPTFLFNIDTTQILWGLSFLIYPIFSVAVFLLAYKLSKNALVSFFSSAFCMFFFGGGTNVFNLFEILPRSLLSLLFIFILYMIFQTNGSDKKMGLKDSIFITFCSLLLFSVIQFTISPSLNRLSPVFLLSLLATLLGFGIIFYKKVKVLPVILVIMLVSLSIALVNVFYFDIDFPSISSFSFFTTLVGIGSAVGLISMLILGKLNLNIPIELLGTLTLVMLFYHQLGLALCLLVSLLIFLSFLIKKRKIWMLRFVAFVVTIILMFLSNSGLRSLFSIGGQLGPAVSVLENTFTTSLLLMFFLGCLILLLRSNAKLHILVFLALTISGAFLIGSFIGFDSSSRLLEFMPFFVAFFSAALFEPLQLFFKSKSEHLNLKVPIFLPKKFKLHSRKSLIIVSLLVILLLPNLIKPYDNFLNSHGNRSSSFSTFSDYEYETGIWINKNIPHNALILSDPFTTLIMSGLSGNGLILNYRMTYDDKGNTRGIFYDPETLNEIKTLLISKDVNTSEFALTQVWNLYSNNFELNQRLINSKSNINQDIIIILSGRTSAWATADGFSDVPFPQDFKMIDGYQKFFNSKSFTLLYENKDQIFVFDWTMPNEG
jgi:hypothetical protein